MLSLSPLSIAVIGSGISGLSAAWLLSKSHNVTLFEAGPQVGGHSATVDCAEPGQTVAVDTGFIVYNEPTYPNLTALFGALGVETAASKMEFSVSLGDGRTEYSSHDLTTLAGSWRNLADADHWRMLRDLGRFMLSAKADADLLAEDMSVASYLQHKGYSAAFIDRHLLPIAAAIWSSPPGQMRRYPAKAFLRFFANHGLLNVRDRPLWRTVRGGSRRYVERLCADGQFQINTSTKVGRVERHAAGVALHTAAGSYGQFDHVVIATHADQALAMLAEPTAGEYTLLSQFQYADNDVVLHKDPSLMPQRRRLWSSWNYLARADGEPQGVTYWMNALQPLATRHNYFVSLNAAKQPDERTVVKRMSYRHPVFNSDTLQAQKDLWALQGQQRTWFCAAYFGSGFHEDGLQAGLAVAEQLGGLQRPWTVANASGRIKVGNAPELPTLPPHLEAAE